MALRRVLIACLVLVAGPLLACEPAPLSGGGDGVVRQGLACAFEGAGKGRSETGRGAEALDLGGGIIAQKLIFGDACYTVEYLLYVDCNVGQGAMAMGLPASDALEGTQYRSIRLIQPPYGPVNVSRAGGLAGFRAMVAQAGVSYDPDVQGFSKRRGASNAFDPACGCALYYPGSPGAN